MMKGTGRSTNSSGVNFTTSVSRPYFAAISWSCAIEVPRSVTAIASMTSPMEARIFWDWRRKNRATGPQREPSCQSRSMRYSAGTVLVLAAEGSPSGLLPSMRTGWGPGVLPSR